MQRQTPLDTSLRGFVSGGARGCLHEANDKKLMQEVKANFLKGETRDAIEHPQNYGFTSYFVKAEYDNDGQIENCAEHFTQFMTGNRAFPVVTVLDDRRYRLRNFKEGESAIYDDQQQKIHLQRNRIYTRSQYKVEMRVIKDQPKMEGHGKHVEADRDQQLDKSRRWSTFVMDKDTITIERTDIINDSDDKDAKKQDEPEQHIKMLSRVFLDKQHVHIQTPSVSSMWDEEKKSLTLKLNNKEKVDDPDSPFTSTIVVDNIAKTITLKTEDTATAFENTLVLDNIAKTITLKTLDKSNNNTNTVVLNGTQENSVVSTARTRNIMQTANTGVHCDEPGNVVHVGEVWASIPAAMLGSIDTAGNKIVQRLARKVLVV